MADELLPQKPLLRGVSHQVAFFATLMAGTVLIAVARTTVGRWGTLIYVLSLAALFGVSALYHRPNWGPAKRRWMRRLDHAAIVVLIAGTMTPVALALPAPASTWFLSLSWAGAAAGVGRALFWIDAPKPLVAIIALATGWAAMPFLPAMRAALGGVTLGWIAAGGVLYTLGALTYAFKRPDPWPRVFGYHEIFHALVVLAALCHFVAVSRVMAVL